MKLKSILLISFFIISYPILALSSLFNIDIGMKSYVGGYYYLNNDKKDFEYKSNHNWYLRIDKSYNEKIKTFADLRYYPELFDKKVYLYSAKVEYNSKKMFDIAWAFDRIGLGKDNFIYQDELNNIRSDKNFISDYRFNGIILRQKLSSSLLVNYLAGGNDHNTGLGAVEIAFKNKRFSSKQAFFLVSRDNRYNSSALNINNQTSFIIDRFKIQNMFHFSIIDYYRTDSDEKSRVFKNFLEGQLNLNSNLQVASSFYYEVENWNKYEIYEINSKLNILLKRFKISPAFKFSSCLDNKQRDYSLLVNYQLSSLWDIGINSQYFYSSDNQDIISYGLQSKFNFPLNPSSIKSIIE